MNKFSKSILKAALIGGFSFFSLSGCNLPEASDLDIATEANGLATATKPTLSESNSPKHLPSALYFLSDESGLFQVWRLSADGNTKEQLTHAPQNVKEYSVSPQDGQLVYLIENQLFLRAIDGSEKLLIDGEPIDEDSDEYYYYEQISGLAWMPNAPIFAYGQNGIHLYNLSTGENSHLLENKVDMLDTGYFYPQALYYPYQWSPTDNQLLISIGFAEGGRLGVLDIASNQLVDLGEGIVCCQAGWHVEGGSVFVASPVAGIIQSGLWAYKSATGEKTTLLDGIAEDNTLNFAGWPHSLPDGTLRFLYTNTAAYPEGELPLTLVSMNPDDITTLTPMRAEAWQVREALWFPDGSGIILIMPPFGVEGWSQSGPVVQVGMAEQSAPLPLATNGYQLQWGP